MPELEHESKPVDITEVRFTFSLKMIIVCIATICSLVGGAYAGYYGITSRIAAVSAGVATQTQTTEELKANIKTLTDRNDALKQQMLELTITLRTKGVIQ